MRRIPALIWASMIVSSLLAAPSYAQEDKLSEVRNWSAGLGMAWGGAGTNYVKIDEGNKIGFTAGIGTTIFGIGGNLGLVDRIGKGDRGIFVIIGGYVSFVIDTGKVGGIAVEYGNVCSHKGDHVWRLGILYTSGGKFYPSAGFGVNF